MYCCLLHILGAFCGGGHQVSSRYDQLNDMELVPKRFLVDKSIDAQMCTTTYKSGHTVQSTVSISFKYYESWVVLVRVCGKAWKVTIVVIMLIVVKSVKTWSSLWCQPILKQYASQRRTRLLLTLNVVGQVYHHWWQSTGSFLKSRRPPSSRTRFATRNRTLRAGLSKITSRRPSFFLVLSCYTLLTIVYSDLYT